MGDRKDAVAWTKRPICRQLDGNTMTGADMQAVARILTGLAAATVLAGGACKRTGWASFQRCETRDLADRGPECAGADGRRSLGVPHIYATSARDAFFLQGFNAARDRLWQIDLWRKRGLGRLSASFGSAYVAQDRAARLLLYRGDMAPEWAAYGFRGSDQWSRRSQPE